MRAYYRNGVWIRFFCAGLVLAGGCTNQTISISDKPDSRKSVAAEFESLMVRSWEGSKDTFLKRDNVIALLLAGGASIAMHNSGADKQLKGNFERHQGIDGFGSEGLKAIGGPGAHFAAAGLWYALSSDTGDKLNQERAGTMLTALTVTGAVTLGLKVIRNNNTPEGNMLAWPSGHTSSSFAVASVLDEFYGPRVGVPAYALASLVGYRMMDEGDHWASDVVFGAVLGWVVGHTIAGQHKELEIAGFKVQPYTLNSSGTALGVNLMRRF